MPVILSALAILLYALGALSLALLVRAAAERRCWLLAAWLASLELLFLAVGTYQFLQSAISAERLAQFAVLGGAGEAAAAIASIAVLCAGLRWAGVPWQVTALLAASAAVCSLFPLRNLVFALCNGAAVIGCVRAGLRSKSAAQERLFYTLGGAFALPATAFALQLPVERVALGYAAPIGVLFFATLRQNVFGLLIGRRTLIVVGLGILSVPYLVLTKILATQIGDSLEAFTSIVEATLILAAAVVWLPLLSWAMRALGRRTELYAEFGRRVINEAVPILDTRERAQFLADGIRRLLRVRAVHISLHGDAAPGRTSREGTVPTEDAMQAAAELLKTSDEECVHRLRARGEGWTSVFATVVYNYLLPLRHENRLLGILWVDSSPKQYLDEYEPVLVEIGRQTSHSLEACRVIEEKLKLERSLMAKEHLAALGNVAATIAHEVKNPLSSIRALAQLMSEDAEFAGKYGRDLGYIVSETDRLNSSVRQLLVFARPPVEEPGDVDVSGLVASIVETVQKEKAGTPARVVGRVAPGLVLHEAGRESVERVVWNLLRNALQATEGRGHVEVVVEEVEDQHVRLSVSDDGPGIREELREQIFEPYFTTRQSGTGLGLAIVKTNVAKLRGTVEVLSPAADGHGTTFTVRLPVGRTGDAQ